MSYALIIKKNSQIIFKKIKRYKQKKGSCNLAELIALVQCLKKLHSLHIHYSRINHMKLYQGLTRIQLPEIKKKKHITNKYWLISEKIASFTITKPNRWLRMVKKNQQLCEKILAQLSDYPNIKNPLGLFNFFYNQEIKKRNH